MIVAGEHAKFSLEKILKDNQVSSYNRETIKLTVSSIDESCYNLKQAAASICLLSDSHVHNQSSAYQVASNRVLREPTNRRSMISNLSLALDNYVSAHLPGRQRLSVAIGISKFVKSQKPYKSFAQPLVNAIVRLFQQLDSQSYTELNLIHFMAFQNAFVKTCNKILDIHKLFTFGPRFSKTSFSQLFSTKEIATLIKDLNMNFLANYSSFQANRFAKRIINNAQFRTSDNVSSSCPSQTRTCVCSIRHATLFIPVVPPSQGCLTQDIRNRNKFLTNNGFYFLSDFKKAITVTENSHLVDGQYRSYLIKVLNPPIIRIRSDISALLTSALSVYLPNVLNDTIFSSCYDQDQNQNLSINQPGIIRFLSGCNITSANDSIFFQVSMNPLIRKNFQNNQLFKGFTLSPKQNFIPTHIFNQIEKDFENSLIGEDTLQEEIKRLAAQSWLSRWVESFSSYLIPAVSGVAMILLSFLVLFVLCNCPPCCCRNLMKSKLCCPSVTTEKGNDDLEKRVEKLETFFSYCITDKYHDIKTEDIRNMSKS